MRDPYRQAMEKIEKTRFRRPSAHEEPDSAPTGTTADNLLLSVFERSAEGRFLLHHIRKMPLCRNREADPANGREDERT